MVDWFMRLEESGGDLLKEKKSCTLLQAGKTRSRSKLKSRRHQCDIVVTE
jgi:hypothetical protein